MTITKMFLKVVCIIQFINILNYQYCQGAPNTDQFVSLTLRENLENASEQTTVKEPVRVDQSGVRGIYPKSCDEATEIFTHSGVFEILPSSSTQVFKVFCHSNTEFGRWTTILMRFDGSVNFYRNWTEYKNGFGNIEGEFFLGLDKIHALTTEQEQELMIILQDFDGRIVYEKYSEFAIGNELDSYVLHTLGEASGTAGDSLTSHRGQKFTTFDRENDIHKWGNCAKSSSGAWWYTNCHYSNLTGRYNSTVHDNGINWTTFRGRDYSLKMVIMLIRPKNDGSQLRYL